VKDKYSNRFLSVAAIIVFMAVILLSRLVYIQVFAEEYKQFAEDNTRKVKAIKPSRGLIVDRNGNRLVTNETAYDLKGALRFIKAFDTTAFCQIFDIDKEFLEKKLEDLDDGGFYLEAGVILKRLSVKSVALFQERQFDFRGFRLEADITRRIEHPVAAHILGYLGEATQRDIEATENYYRLQDYIGKSGIERQYEEVLRGEKGYQYVVKDKYSREIGKYADGANDIPAKKGLTVMSTIDLDLQAYGEQLMKNKLGAIVAIEPATGEILAMVSSPTYDPTQLTGQGRSNMFAELSADTNKPLYNRAITGYYPPGSTFKPIMALVGLQEGVISASTTFPCRMGYTIPGLHVGCHAHTNYLDLRESIAQSCNAYYCHTFRDCIDQSKFANTQEGFEKWREYMMQFGMGVTLGVDIPNEKKGDFPTVGKYDAVYGAGRWRSSYIISLAIGQAEISLTPLQMANMTAVVANRGFYYTPHLVKDPIVRPIEKKTVPIEKRHFESVIGGMEEVFITGTARWYALDSLIQCGKTGTAQNPHGEDHSNFVLFAPKNDPQIAIAVVVENGGYGSTWAAPIASLMAEQYLTDTITRPHFEKKMFEKDFIHKEPENALATDSLEE